MGGWSAKTSAPTLHSLTSSPRPPACSPTAAGVVLRVHDPEALGNVRELYGSRLVYCDRPYGALEGADGLVVVTEWPEFRNPDFEVMRRLMRERVIFDGRNLYEPRQMEKLGFAYYAIGRGRT